MKEQFEYPAFLVNAEDSEVKHGSYCPVLQQNALKVGVPAVTGGGMKGGQPSQSWRWQLPNSTLPKTNSLPGPKRKFIFQPSIFRGELLVSGRVVPGGPIVLKLDIAFMVD